MTDTVKLLSDDALREIEARAKKYQQLAERAATPADEEVIRWFAKQIPALCQTVRALWAENEQLKEELFEHQPINQIKRTESSNKKRAERIAARFTKKFCKAAPLAATGEFRAGLEASIQSALDSANTTKGDR